MILWGFTQPTHEINFDHRQYGLYWSPCCRVLAYASTQLAVDRARYRLLRRKSAGFRITGARAGCATVWDVRAITAVDLTDVDAVIHLAAISNDPMGNAYERVTEDINYQGTLAVARAAREAGARHFVFASSCSVYGFAEDGARNEQSSVNPLTAYARSKVASEQSLAQLAGPDFIVTCLRFATACGASPRLRLDLVLNDFVASAVTSGVIKILSDGTPWRPLINVEDMARAFDWAIDRSALNGGEFLGGQRRVERLELPNS